MCFNNYPLKRQGCRFDMDKEGGNFLYSTNVRLRMTVNGIASCVNEEIRVGCLSSREISEDSMTTN